MKHWIPCRPLDRTDLGMMRFILETCQDIKRYTADRIVNGDRKGSVKPQEELKREWIMEYLRSHKVAWDVPRFALHDAMTEILTNGVKVPPQERRDYNVFTVEPRAGWKKKEEKEELDWGEYLEGTKKKPDGREVKPDIAVQRLYEEGIITFRWGGVQLRGDYVSRLVAQAEKEGIEKEQILRRTVSIDFAKSGKPDVWKDWTINFNLE